MKPIRLLATLCMLFVACFVASAQTFETVSVDDISLDINHVHVPMDIAMVSDMDISDFHYDVSDEVDPALSIPIHIDVAYNYDTTPIDGDVVRTILRNQCSKEPKQLLCSTYIEDYNMEISLYSDQTYAVIHKPPLTSGKLAIIRQKATR